MKPEMRDAQQDDRGCGRIWMEVYGENTYASAW